MDRSERFKKIIALLKSRSSIRKDKFLEEIDISESTFKRDVEYLRDRMGAPIVWDRSLKGYRLELKNGQEAKYELPGLWFNASEMYAILAMNELLTNIQPGLLTSQLEPLKTQIRAILEQGNHRLEDFNDRIRILSFASRKIDLELFGVVSDALLTRNKLQISYSNRERDELTNRVVSPQRLVHYRENWYVDAWCHLRSSIRTFSLEAITNAEKLSHKSKELSKKRLSSHLASSYGIFSGKPDKLAVLKFSQKLARWVSSETWHPKQITSFDSENAYFMKIPYHDERELIMDILKYGDEVEVIGPIELRNSVARKLANALSKYD
tara:strand:+ start:2078 stop:3049 length:972 start_codon:yes stop_codon:yes gene_type:complete